MAIGIEQGRLKKGDHVAMLGIGSGINCQMLAVDWQRAISDVEVDSEDSDRQSARSLPAAAGNPQSAID